MPHLLEFRWQRCVDGYELIEEPAEPGETLLSDKPASQWIRPRSDRMETIRPLDRESALFRVLADIENVDDLLEFTNAFGPLELRQRRQELAVHWALQYPPSLRKAIEAISEGDYGQVAVSSSIAPFGRCTVQLAYRPGQAPVTFLVPDDLISAIHIQLFQFASNQQHLASCLWCGSWFVYGTGTGRRRSAHYCSDNCRKAAHRHQKKGG